LNCTAIFLELIPVFEIPMACHLSAIVSLRLAILSFKLIKVKFTCTSCGLIMDLNVTNWTCGKVQMNFNENRFNNLHGY
jgi:hypothetical protein